MPEGTTGHGASPTWSLDLRGSEAPVLVQVRRWASGTLNGVDDAHLGDVLMVVTELVTNAYDHGQGPREVRMAYTPVPCRVLVEVDDSCLDRPVVASPSPTTPGGRGMMIVEKLATTWGVREHRETGSKTVWAEIACDGADAEPRARSSREAAREGDRGGRKPTGSFPPVVGLLCRCVESFLLVG